MNAHIWPPGSAAQDVVLFDLQPERAFDHRELAFVENDAGALVAKVVNQNILSDLLTGTTATFNDIQDAPLLLPCHLRACCRYFE